MTSTKDWEYFRFSKNQVRKAAKLLIKNDAPLDEKLEAYAVLANFRSAHAYPMQAMIGYFRKKAFEVDKKAIVVRRLKRIPSILSKLVREKSMQPDTMGDIGGIRIILKNIQQAYQLREKFIQGKSKNKLIFERNYLDHPKGSGYRSIHLTYAYQGAKQPYKGFRVELQIRSQVQHAWATAVEVVGTFNREHLKASEGSADWLRFFKLTSWAFASLEAGTQMEQELKHELKNACDALNVFDSLKGYRIVAKHMGEEDGSYLLKLDIEENTIAAVHFEKSFLEDAYQEYRRIEQEIADDKTKDVVLVSVQSLKELKKAYPNYFADTALFLNHLQKVMQ